MKTIALIIILFFGASFSSSSHAENGPDSAINCCLDVASANNQNEFVLDQLQNESEAIPVDNVTGLTSAHLTKSVTEKMQAQSMEDQIQSETEDIAPSHLRLFSKKSVSAQNEDSDSGMLDKLQKETESVSITKPIFFLVSKIESIGSGKSAHVSARNNGGK